ncbi:MAG TPA: hypothetical protein PKW63_05620 [Vicinamibacterales bacterium]|nr:hypothetical protein [Vicinamibacterales bacterium]
MLDFLLILHFIGLALGVGTGFAMLTLGLSTADMAPADRGAFMRRASVITRNGAIGLTLLILSGVGLVMTRGVQMVMDWGGPMFHVKLTLVAIMIGVFGYLQVLLRQSRSADGAAAAARIPLVSRVMLVLGVSVVVFAVLAFH